MNISWKITCKSWKKMDSQKWRMKQKLVSKKNNVNLIETFSAAFY